MSQATDPTPSCHLPATRTVMRLEWRPCALVAEHSYSPPWLPRAPATLNVLLLLDRPMLSAPGGARQLIWAGGQASARQVKVKFPPGRTPPAGDAANSATTGRSEGNGRLEEGSAAARKFSKCSASAYHNLRPPLLECSGKDTVSLLEIWLLYGLKSCAPLQLMGGGGDPHHCPLTQNLRGSGLLFPRVFITLRFRPGFFVPGNGTREGAFELLWAISPLQVPVLRT